MTTTTAEEPASIPGEPTAHHDSVEQASCPLTRAGFGFAHALVLTGFVAAGIVLRLSTTMTTCDICVLIGSLGMVGVGVLVSGSGG
ncbi:hypothetical protein NX801_27105 [Streptomyces sp. LP05-1]|uniref:Integral membrane protein n=1 Tax=Streptomyces pyxinae TaxID=2970734 RepID=A0ABT2CRN8_9ACTN|nr:hypothetical protein [Streptomyces sp. LP05-1]MCS0639244.1 hypothetical protein [Streptomyces sp. LP05-1]